MKTKAKDSKKKQTKVKDLRVKKDVKGGSGVPLTDKSGNPGGPGRRPVL